jgi:hypothetical protein
MECIKRWLLGLDTVKDLFSHPFECLIFFLFTIIIDLDMLFLSWINTSFKELLEIFFKSLLPKERFIAVRCKELVGSIKDFLELL